MKFYRKWAQTLYKSQRITLGEMSFHKDITNTSRGNPYPLLEQKGKFTETVGQGVYTFDGAKTSRAVRLFTQFFPFAGYELEAKSLLGSAGFRFFGKDWSADVSLNADGEKTWISFNSDTQNETVEVKDYQAGDRFLVSLSGNSFVYYVKRGDGFILEGMTVYEALAEKARDEKEFFYANVALTVSGKATLTNVTAFVDTGIAQADLRPIRYENGDVMVDQGKVYFTMTSRARQGGCSIVLAWTPTTSELMLTGALFFVGGNGKWGNVASSVLFNRKTGKWMTWVRMRTTPEQLGYAEFDGDPRFGIIPVDVTLLPLTDSDDFTVFLSRDADEDPDFLYDEKRKKWLLAICRIDKEGGYLYYFFESKNPFTGYKYIGKGSRGDGTEETGETGGSFVRIKDKMCFICGNAFKKKSNYRIYDMDDLTTFKEAEFDYPDGGFRGWGTLMAIPCGTRKRLYWMTFDRDLASEIHNWSYGNLYLYEADNDEL